MVPWLTDRIPIPRAPAVTKARAGNPPATEAPVASPTPTVSPATAAPVASGAAPTWAEWGTSANLTIQVEELSGLNPGVSLITPLENSLKVFPVAGNVTSPQSFSFGIGASATAHSTRTETIQFTYSNPDLLKRAVVFDKNPDACASTEIGIMIVSNLKIDQFIYDKATIAAFGNDISTNSTNRNWAPFSLFQETIIFVASYGGSVTPTWKFAAIAVDPNSTLLNATRTKTNTLIITLGELSSQKATATSPAALSTAAQNQHNNAAAGASVAGQIKASM
jgi:hypothetical protein